MNTKKILVGLLAVAAISIGIYSGVLAYSGLVYGRATNHGYFTDIIDNWGEEVLPPIYDHNTNAIPDSVDTVNKFVNFLKNAYSSDQQSKTGSAFIVNTMLGRNGDRGTRIISNADWKALTDLLNTYEIHWHQWITDDINSYYQGVTGYDTDPSPPNPNDDAFFSDNRSGPGIEFTTNGSNIVYKIIRECANPIGDKVTPPPPQPPESWKMIPSTTVSPANAKLGNTITWTHTIKNTGNSDTNTTITYNWLNEPNLNPIGETGPSPFWSVANVKANKSISKKSTYIVQSGDIPQPGDPNNQLCRSTQVQPKGSNGGGTRTSGAACATIKAPPPPVKHWSLTPYVTTNPTSSIEVGGTVEVKSYVINSLPDESDLVTWSLSRTPSSTKTLPSGEDVFPGNDKKDVPYPPYGDDDTADLPVGTKVCYVLTIQPKAWNNSGSARSAKACVFIGKKPKTQIWGGDLLVGGNVTTSTSTIKGNTFGSWAEYGIIASGGITGAASGAAFAGPGMSGYTVCGASKLSFTNTPLGGTSCTDSGIIGNYSNAVDMPDIAASFPGGSTLGSSVRPGSKASGTYTRTGNLSLSASTLTSGQSIIIKATGTVTINGDQKYLDNYSYTDIGQLPQLIIIAKNINIKSTVKNVDAWLIAQSGSINTCSPPVTTQLTASICNNPLQVNGPVMADKLYLRRTFGADSSTKEVPAEIFNLRADAYLWAIDHATTDGHIQTVYSTELPPRL